MWNTVHLKMFRFGIDPRLQVHFGVFRNIHDVDTRPDEHAHCFLNSCKLMGHRKIQEACEKQNI